MAEHVHVMPADIQARRNRLSALLRPLVELLRAEDHWVIGPEHIDLLDELDSIGASLRDDIDGAAARHN